MLFGYPRFLYILQRPKSNTGSTRDILIFRTTSWEIYSGLHIQAKIQVKHKSLSVIRSKNLLSLNSPNNFRHYSGLGKYKILPQNSKMSAGEQKAQQ